MYVYGLHKRRKINKVFNHSIDLENSQRRKMMMSLNINRSGSSCQHSYQNRNTSKYSRFDFIHDLRLFISSSRDEISVLLESAHQKERSSSEQKAEMAFKIMDRLISNSNYLYYLFLYDVRHSVTIK